MVGVEADLDFVDFGVGGGGGGEGLLYHLDVFGGGDIDIVAQLLDF